MEKRSGYGQEPDIRAGAEAVETAGSPTGSLAGRLSAGSTPGSTAGGQAAGQEHNNTVEKESCSDHGRHSR